MVIGKAGSRKHPRRDFGKESDFIDSHHLSPGYVRKPCIQCGSYLIATAVVLKHPMMSCLIHCRFHFPDVRSPRLQMQTGVGIVSIEATLIITSKTEVLQMPSAIKCKPRSGGRGREVKVFEFLKKMNFRIFF